jgi:hypothetical protein
VEDGAVDWVAVDVGLGEFVLAGLEKEVEPMELNERSGGIPSDCEETLRRLDISFHESARETDRVCVRG